MPKISENAQEKSTNPIAMAAEANPQLVIPYPVMLCGVNRKINIGNFETIDVYSAIGVPLSTFDPSDLEVFKAAAEAAADIGFSITSKETGARYNAIHEMQAGGRK